MTVVFCFKINFAQISIEKADNTFRNNIIELFDLNDITLEIMLSMVKDIYSDYPKCIKGGNV